MKKTNKGFTLVELIIVIAILAIIMLIAIPNFSGIQQRMQVRADKATAAQIGKAVRVWFTDYTTDKSLLIAAGSESTAPGTVAPSAFDGTSHDFTALSVVSGGSVAPDNYESLIHIDGYISKGQKPSSLKKDDGTTDDTQFYGVFLTNAATSTDAKVGVAVTGTTGASVVTDVTVGTTAGYDGSDEGVAYIEP